MGNYHQKDKQYFFLIFYFFLSLHPPPICLFSFLSIKQMPAYQRLIDFLITKTNGPSVAAEIRWAGRDRLHAFGGLENDWLMCTVAGPEVSPPKAEPQARVQPPFTHDKPRGIWKLSSSAVV